MCSTVPHLTILEGTKEIHFFNVAVLKKQNTTTTIKCHTFKILHEVFFINFRTAFMKPHKVANECKKGALNNFLSCRGGQRARQQAHEGCASRETQAEEKAPRPLAEAPGPPGASAVGERRG